MQREYNMIVVILHPVIHQQVEYGRFVGNLQAHRILAQQRREDERHRRPHTNGCQRTVGPLLLRVAGLHGRSEKSVTEEEALDYALSQVNNVSKKRLMGSLQDVKARLFEMEPAPNTEKRKNPFLEMLAKDAQASAQEACNYSGIYLSYSLSSAADALKIEPYLITVSENNEYVRVVHMSAYGTTHTGICLFNNHTSAYIMFNERETPEIALFTIYLQLPMYDFPQMLKGLYLCLDYNRNPIARRILFIKQSDSTSMDDFLTLKGEIIPKTQIPEALMPYYRYTCQPGDYIKTCTVPTPSLDANDLEREKKMLNI